MKKEQLIRKRIAAVSGLRRKRKTFTLIELLVVIAIIAILAGMLLPALNKAKQTAYSVKCLGQQKQIGVMMLNYTQDFKEYLPIGNILYPGDGEAYTFQIQLTMLNYNVPVKTAVSKEKQKVYPWTCPSQNLTWEDKSLGVANFLGNYVVNGTIVGMGGRINEANPNGVLRYYSKLGKFKEPSNDGVLMDGLVKPILSGGDPNPLLNGGLHWIQLNGTYQSVDYRHSNKCNVLFLDGHAAALQRQLYLPIAYDTSTSSVSGSGCILYR